MSKLTVAQQKAKVAATIKVNGNQEITPPKDKVLRDDQLDSSPNWKDGGFEFEAEVGYNSEITVADPKAFVPLHQVQEEIEDAISDIDLSEYLPKSAGSGQELTGPLYLGGNGLYRPGSMFDDTDVLFWDTNSRQYYDQSGATIMDLSNRLNGIGFFNNDSWETILEFLSTANKTLFIPDAPDGSTFAMVEDIQAYVDAGIDVTATGGSDVLNLGTSNADVINIGHSGAIVNILGSALFEYVANAYVGDKLITINDGGAAASAVGAGFEIEEDSLITGYFKTNGTRNGYLFKVPAVSSDLNFDLSLLTGNRTATLPDSDGVFTYNDLAQTLTNKTLTSPVINVGSDAPGDIYYRNPGGLFTRLAASTNGFFLSLSSGLPSWQSIASSVLNTALTGLSVATAQAVVATDTVLQAIGYIQGQLNLLNTDRVYTVKVSLTSSQILNSNTTAIELVPAPGAGKYIEPIRVSGKLNFNTTPYTTNLNASLRFQTGNSFYQNTSILASTVSRMMPFLEFAPTGTTSLYHLENKRLEFFVGGSNPLAGNSSMDLYVTYKIATF